MAKRYDGLDMLKTICAFLIVCIHAPFGGNAGGYITALARIAVPVFFMITGYFYDHLITSGNDKRQIKKTLVLCLGANFLYFAYYACVAIFKGSLLQYLQETFTPINILKCLVLNESMFNSHLWYLGALLYVLIILYALRKVSTHWKKIIYVITPILLLGDLILGKYSLFLFNREFPYIIVRNFLFVGIPYFSIGIFIRENEDAFLFRNIKNKRFIGFILCLFFIFTTIFERFILLKFNINATRDHYISSTLLAITLFVVFLRDSWNNERFQLPKRIGREYSAMIYIVHPLVIQWLGFIISKVNYHQFYDTIRPLWIFLITTIGVACFGKLVAFKKKD